MRHLALGTLDRAGQPSARLIRLATAAAVLYSLYQPLMRLYGIADEAPLKDATHLGVAAIGLVCFLTPMLWLTISATRSERRRVERWAFLAVLGVIFAFTPLVGGSWAGMLYFPSALALVLLAVPWNLALFASLVASEAVLAVVFGLPSYVGYFMVGTISLGVPLAILIVAIRKARQLQSARQQLADEAVLRERSRLNEELRAAFENRLATVARQADRAAELAATDLPRSRVEMRALVQSSRATLADARQLARRYRDGSLRSELETTVALLEAAGIEAHVELPVGELAASVDEELRHHLRRAVTELLAREPGGAVTIAVVSGDGRLSVAARPRLERTTKVPELT